MAVHVPIAAFSERDIERLIRAAATEADHSIASRDRAVYDAQVAGILDVMMNRVASDQFPDDVAAMLNQRNQFSAINGPQRSYTVWGSVDNIPAHVVPAALRESAMQHLAERYAGAPSSVGPALHYANPHYSDAHNRRWINALEGPRVGIGDSVHYHGTTAGFTPTEAVLATHAGLIESFQGRQQMMSAMQSLIENPEAAQAFTETATGWRATGLHQALEQFRRRDGLSLTDHDLRSAGRLEGDGMATFLENHLGRDSDAIARMSVDERAAAVTAAVESGALIERDGAYYDASRPSNIDIAAYNRERGLLEGAEAQNQFLANHLEKSAEEIAAMSDEERQAAIDQAVSDGKLLQEGNELFDPEQAEFGEASQAMFAALGEELNRLQEEEPELFAQIIEDFQEESEAQAIEAAERRRQQNSLDNRVGNALGADADPFGMILGALLLTAMGRGDLAQQMMNNYFGMGGSGSYMANGYSPGVDRPDDRPAGERVEIPPLNTGGLNVRPSDIANAEALRRLSTESGISVDMLRERAESVATAINGLHPDIKGAVLAGVRESWESGVPVVLDSHRSGGPTTDQFGFRGNGSFAGVDQRLTHIIEATARDFPLRVRVMSGRRGRSSGDHARGLAIDITLFDQNGEALGNYQNEENFRAYELFAQAAYLNAERLYPELVDGRGADFNWGGLFGDNGPGRYKYGSNDAMDFRIATNNRFRAGTIMGGLNARHGNYDTGDVLGGSQAYSPEAFAEGMRALETLRLTPEQAAHNRRTMFGVARASGSLEERPDGYLNGRFLAFNVVPLDSQGNPLTSVGTQQRDAITQIFANYGFSTGTDQETVAFHVGPNADAFVGLSTIPGSRQTVVGGLPVIPADWRHESWQATIPTLDANGRPIVEDPAPVADEPAVVDEEPLVSQSLTPEAETRQRAALDRAVLQQVAALDLARSMIVAEEHRSGVATEQPDSIKGALADVGVTAEQENTPTDIASAADEAPEGVSVDGETDEVETPDVPVAVAENSKQQSSVATV